MRLFRIFWPLIKNCKSYAYYAQRQMEKAGDSRSYVAFRKSDHVKLINHMLAVSGDRTRWIGYVPYEEHVRKTLSLSKWNPRRYWRVVHFPGQVVEGDPTSTELYPNLTALHSDV